MRIFSYRNKLRLRSFLMTLLVALAVLAAFAVGIFLYLQRYIVYTPDGAHLDFGSRAESTGKTAQDMPLNPEFVIESSASSAPASGTAPASAQLSGYYVTAAMLDDVQAVSDALASSDGTVSILMDVKSTYGNFFYNSSIPGASVSGSLDTDAVGALISSLAGRNDVYLVARVPAFSDSNFALANQSCGLPLSSGALWMDADGNYWLDPASDAVISYLESVATELQTLGFDEVAFDDFYFPDSANISYDADRESVVTEAARRLAANLSGSRIAVSFDSTNAALAPYARHFYVEADDGGAVQEITDGFSGALTDPASSLVFLTDSRDTRFETYGLLRPALESGGEEP